MTADETAAALATAPVPWIGKPAPNPAAPENRALFTRFIRRRNFAGHPFWAACPHDACDAIAARAREYAETHGFGNCVHLADRGSDWRNVLRERDQLPERPASFPGKRDFKMFWFGNDAGEHALFGETEHWTWIRVRPGLFLEKSDAAAGGRDEGSEFCRSPEWGYLTSNPAFAGAGLQLCIGLHLPGLIAARRLPQAQRALEATGFELRPLSLRLPGAAEAGFLLLLSRGGMNLSEEDMRMRCAGKVSSLLAAETEAFGRWHAREAKLLEDRAHRALRILQEARNMDSVEFLRLSSLARNGVYAGFFPVSLLAALEELRIKTRPFHLLAPRANEDLRGENVLRADLVRGALLGI